MKKKLSKKGDWARKWRSFRRHTWLCLETLTISVVMALLGRWLRQRGIHFCKEDEVVLTGGITAAVAVAYSITAALVFNSVYEKYKKVMACVLLKDKHTFLLHRDERMPVVIHIFLASLSVLLTGIIMMLNYREELGGMAAVFSVSYFVSLYWFFVVQLENPAKSPWLAERVPPEWLTEDVDKYFELENGAKNNAG